MTRSILELLEQRAAKDSWLHEQLLDAQMVRFLETSDFDPGAPGEGGPLT